MDIIKNLPNELQDLILEKVYETRLVDAEVARRWICIECVFTRVIQHVDSYIQYERNENEDFGILMYVCINEGMFIGNCFVDYTFWSGWSKDVHCIPVMNVETRSQKGMHGWKEMAGVIKKVLGQFVGYTYSLGAQNFKMSKEVACKMIYPDWKQSCLEKRLVIKTEDVGKHFPTTKNLARVFRDVWEPKINIVSDLFRTDEWCEMEEKMKHYSFDNTCISSFYMADSCMTIDYEETKEPFCLEDIEEIAEKQPEVFRLMEEHGLLCSKKRQIPKEIAILMEIRYKHGVYCNCTCREGCREIARRIMIQYGLLDCRCELQDYTNPCKCAEISFEIPKLHEIVEQLSVKNKASYNI